LFVITVSEARTYARKSNSLLVWRGAMVQWQTKSY